jgi:predicted RNase H-like HicB family nuclease
MKYPVVIHKDPGSDYGVTIPDLPGCFSAGSTLDEAFANAVEAAECHIEGIMLDCEDIPSPASVEQHVTNPDYADGIWGMIDVDLAKLLGRSRRINITLPERLLTQIDRHTAKTGVSRSGYLAEAAIEYGTRHGT